MTTNLGKIEIDRPDMICLNELDNLNQAGSMYVVIHKPKRGSGSEKKMHYGLAIDVSGMCKYYFFLPNFFSIFLSGSSTATDFVATHYDLYVVSPIDYSTYVGSMFKSRQWNDYSSVRKVGNIRLKK
jgi:hypothetical protein